jgi:hypothetical protein
LILHRTIARPTCSHLELLTTTTNWWSRPSINEPRANIFKHYRPILADNSGMDKDADLLPWILSGVALATAAIALIVSSHLTANPPTSSQADSPPAAPAPPRTLEAPITATVSLPAAPVPAVEPEIQSIEAPAVLPAPSQSQIWECSINGQKIFADHPCGENPSLREVNAVNLMAATPMPPHGLNYAPPPVYQPDYAEPAYMEPAYVEPAYAENSYPVFVGVPVYDRRRPPLHRRPHGHATRPAPMPRRN